MMICLFQKRWQKFLLHLAQSHVGVSVVMMARPIVTQEAWKNNDDDDDDDADNAEKEDVDDYDDGQAHSDSGGLKERSSCW